MHVGINQHINISKSKYATALEVWWQVLVLSFIKTAHIRSYGLQEQILFSSSA